MFHSIFDLFGDGSRMLYGYFCSDDLNDADDGSDYLSEDVSYTGF